MKLGLKLEGDKGKIMMNQSFSPIIGQKGLKCVCFSLIYPMALILFYSVLTDLYKNVPLFEHTKSTHFISVIPSFAFVYVYIEI